MEMDKRVRYRLFYLLRPLLVVVGMASPASAGTAPPGTAQSASAQAAAQPDVARSYTNPLDVLIPGDGRVESCADPSIIRGQQSGDNYWYIYCTTDPLNGQDR